MMFVATGARPTRKAFPTTTGTLVVAVALLALGTFAALIPASEAKNAEHSYSAAIVRPIGRRPLRRFPPSLRRRLR
jgi:hypothetical protein